MIRILALVSALQTAFILTSVTAEARDNRSTCLAKWDAAPHYNGPEDEGAFYMMNDGSVDIRYDGIYEMDRSSGSDTFNIPHVQLNAGRADVNTIALADYQTGDTFEGPGIRVVLQNEFRRPRQRRDRRFFVAEYQINTVIGGQAFVRSGHKECAFGLR